MSDPDYCWTCGCIYEASVGTWPQCEDCWQETCQEAEDALRELRAAEAAE